MPLAQFEQLQDAGGPAVAETWLVPGSGHIGASAENPDAYAARVVTFFNASRP